MLSVLTVVFLAALSEVANAGVKNVENGGVENAAVADGVGDSSPAGRVGDRASVGGPKC